MVHVDGDHSYSGTLHDLELAWKASSQVLVDDYGSIPDVRRAVDDFCAAQGVKIDTLDDKQVLLTDPSAATRREGEAPAEPRQREGEATTEPKQWEGEAPAEPRRVVDFPLVHGSAGASPSQVQGSAGASPSQWCAQPGQSIELQERSGTNTPSHVAMHVDGTAVEADADYSLRFVQYLDRPATPVLYFRGRRLIKPWTLELFHVEPADRWGSSG